MKIKCSYCGNEVLKTEAIEYNGELYCDDCIVTCDDCEELTIRDDTRYISDSDRIVCEDCFDENYFECIGCGEYHCKDNAYYIDSEDGYVCEDCYSDNYGSCDRCGYSTTIDNLVYSEYNGCYYCEGCYEGEEDDDDRKTYNYHSNLGRDNLSEGYRYRVGVELEREDKAFLEGLTKEEYLNEYGWVIEDDGSLGFGGFEAISPVYALRLGKLERVFKESTLRKLTRALFSDRCGGHMTISDTKRTPDELIDDIGGYLPMLYAMFPNRTSNHYCSPLEKDSYKQGGRYALHKRGDSMGSGLEIRLFDAPENEIDLQNRFRLLKYLLQHKAPTVEQGLRELSDSEKLRKVVRLHLNRFDISYQSFYENIVRYAREIDKVGLNKYRTKRIINKLK